MTLFILSFVAGILTVLAPCVLPLLPVIIGGSITSKDSKKPYLVIGGLVISITVFTILLKASTLLIDIDPSTWKLLSGIILICFGLIYIFPKIWDKISFKLRLSASSDKLLDKASEKEGVLGSLLLGGALGPVFASCSPTYSLIIATVLPVNFFEGVLYIIVYALGLAVVMLAISLLGRKLVTRLNTFADPKGWFKKTLGILFLIIGIFVITGFDKTIETNILNSNSFDITKIEQQILNKNMNQDTSKNNSNILNMNTDKSSIPELNQDGSKSAPEITGIGDWLNSNGETIAGLKGKVVLVDFWTYSCINCQRTLPFVTKWYDTYKDKGFTVLGVHAPEFSFEKKKENVQKAVKDFNINYPVALDNDFKTWNAYNNQFWPAEYLINKDGKIVRTHFGEGGYDETEKAIRYLLDQKDGQMVTDSLKTTTPIGQSCKDGICTSQTPETYLGLQRAKNFANFSQISKSGILQKFSLITSVDNNFWSLGGDWLVGDQAVTSAGGDSKLRLKFSAKEVYLVMGSKNIENITLKVDGKLKNLGDDVDSTGNLQVQNYKLYKLVKSDNFLVDSTLDITFPEGVEINAFTFG